MPTFHPYPAYKSSGVPWLDDMPEHWDVRRGGWLFRKMDRAVRDADEVITCFRDGTVTLRKKRRTDGFTESLKEIGYQGVRKGDLIIHQMDAFAGAIGVSDSDGKGTPVYSVCHPNQDADPFYYAHIVREMARSQWIRALAKGIRERSTDFRYSEFALQALPLPPLAEQAAIVRYLDYVDRRIRRYVTAKQKLIALLEEKKQAVVNQAITRGLDPNVCLKPSGIEWLGEVPEHWAILQFGRVIDLATGYPFNSEGFSFDADDIRLLRGINVSLGVLRWRDVVRWPRADCNAFDAYRMEIGDIVLGMDRPFIEGGVRVASVSENDVPALLLQRVARIRPRQELSSTFTSLLLTGKSFADYLRPLFTGISVPHVSPEQIKSYRIALPNMREQTQIVDHVMSMSRSIQLETDRARRQIELLQEYRTRLIADVVTGKLDVRSAEAGLPEEAEDEEPIDEGSVLADEADRDLYDAGNFKEESAIESEVGT